MAEEQPDQSGEGSKNAAGTTRSVMSKRKGFISPTSSFIDFGTLETEYYTPEMIAEADSYNPHDHRRLKKPITDFETATHVLKGSVGAGILAMPMAFSNIGVTLGIIITFPLCMLCIYAIHVLIKTQYVQCQRLRTPFLALPTSMRIGFKNGPHCLRCFAPLAPILVDFFLVFYQLGICTAYVMFVAKALKKVAESRLTGDGLDEKWYMLMIFIPVCITNFIRDLKKLMPLSLCANVLIVFSLVCCLYYMIFVGEWKTHTVHQVAPIQQWPLFVGTVLFALEAVGVIIALEHNMEQPEHFLGCWGIFPWCLTIVALLYLAFGSLGYLKYGKDVKDTIFDSISESIQSKYISESISANVVLFVIIYAIYGICIFLSYPLQCFVSLEIIWGNYLRHVVKNPMKECIVEYILRTVTVIITFLAAALFPSIDLVISLVGAFCISTLAMIFPFVLELCTKWPVHISAFTLIKDILLILLGFVILITGTYTSLYSTFKADSNSTVTESPN